MSQYHDDFYREKWMNDDQWECAKLLADLFYGFNHITGTIKKDWSGIKVAETPAIGRPPLTMMD
jgi:hypothetical protein